MNKKIEHFSDLNLSAQQLENLDQLAYKKTTPIQSLALPPIMAGRDVVAKANTGSGKTAAFGIGVLCTIEINVLQTQSLVLCPTRELATQVSQELRRLGRYLPNLRIVTLYGGTSKYHQKTALANPPHIVVGTPGRVLDHLESNHLDINHLKTLVLDEADRMLDMGFNDEVMDVIRFAPAKRQTLLFSATYPEGIEQMSKQVQTDPVFITAPASEQKLEIKQLFFQVSKAMRINALLALLSEYQPQSCLVFCNTKAATTTVCDALNDMGMHAAVLNGDLEQRDRDQTMMRFNNASCRILVATDVAARGIDVKALSMVVNYDMANSVDMYTHRIGRTGRAGLEGLAINFCDSRDDYKVNEIEELLGTKVEWGDISLVKTKSTIPKMESKMITIRIDSGKKSKIRAGDILGALIGELKITTDAIGKIDLFDTYSCVAIAEMIGKQLLQQHQSIKIKGRVIKIRTLVN